MITVTRTNLLWRIQETCRQTRAHLHRIERQISTRAERMTTTAKAKARSHPRRGSLWTRSDEALFRSDIDQLDFERRSEIEAFGRKLTRQERAVLTVRTKTTGDGSSTGADTRLALERQECLRQATVNSFTSGAGGMPPLPASLRVWPRS